ncbi:repeat protein, partial [Enterococcus faecalis 02-MB-P-10]|uniref:LPXTG cell wall anchor domain-containing protein n=1 Tax=Enterococcus faecalis TaxID=1351 RepID=UPI000353B0A3
DKNVPPTPPVETKLSKVELTKAVDKTTAQVGEELTYTVVAKNTGEGDWTGTIIDKLSSEFVSMIPGTTSINGNLVKDSGVWKGNVLNAKVVVKSGETATITFKVKTLKAAEGKEIVNVAETDDNNVPPTPPVVTKVPPMPKTPSENGRVPGNPGNGPKGSTPDTSGRTGLFPSTGTKNSTTLMVIGLLVILVVVFSMIYYKKKETSSK